MFNNCSFVGRVGTIETKQFPGKSGDMFQIVEVSLALNTNHKDKTTGEWVSETTWLNLVLKGKQAEAFANSIAKGDILAIGASYTPNVYEKDGKKVTYPQFTVSTWRRVSKGNGGGGQAVQEEADEVEAPF